MQIGSVQGGDLSAGNAAGGKDPVSSGILKEIQRLEKLLRDVRQDRGLTKKEALEYSQKINKRILELKDQLTQRKGVLRGEQAKTEGEQSGTDPIGEPSGGPDPDDRFARVERLDLLKISLEGRDWADEDETRPDGERDEENKSKKYAMLQA